MKNISILTIVIFMFLFSLHCTSKVYAINMRSSQYRIQFSDVNIGATNYSSSTYRLSSSLGQTAAKEFSSSGYIVKAGFQYLKSIIPFRFSLSTNAINFGTVLPTTFYTDSAIITVSFGSAGQYQVTAGELGKMTTLNGASTIPDTLCNQNAPACTISSAAVWDTASYDGFGYNMSGTGVPADFTNSTYFRPFANINDGATPQVIMSSVNIGKTHQSTITFKLNASATQPAGTYQTIIRFVATPSF